MNAHSLHDLEEVTAEPATKSSMRASSTKTKADPTMLNYVLHGQATVDAGTIFWTWRRLLTRELFDTEGIWIPTRLVTMQGTLFCFFIVLSLILSVITNWLSDQAAEAQETINPDLPDWVLRYVSAEIQKLFDFVYLISVNILSI